MKSLGKVVIAAVLSLSYVGAVSLANAQSVSSAAPQNSMSEGEIKKVDKDGGKLTIKHGELKNLGMPGMTMVFRTKDAGMLEKVKQGDKVRFVAEKVDGALTVTAIGKTN
jgi:Cu(I)/Ag(I) efflux system protein CusF